jgi:acetyl-CoA carboxylase biotin carboxylase subunit
MKVADERRLRSKGAVDRALGSRAAFGDDAVYIEKYLGSRAISSAGFGDGRGNAVHLGERDCSLQRATRRSGKKPTRPR